MSEPAALTTPAPSRLACSGCGRDLFAQRRGQRSLVARILVWDASGQAGAVCQSCGSKTAIPWLPLPPSDGMPPPVRLVVRTGQ